MSQLSDSIQRQRVMDSKGHNIMILETRSLQADRCKPTRRVVDDTSKPIAIIDRPFNSSLSDMLKDM